MAKSRGLMFVFALVMAVFSSLTMFAATQANGEGDASRLKPAYRFERSKWIYVHLEGSPSDIGYQHGYLLAPEIADGFNVVKFRDTHRTQRDWNFFRKTAETVIW